LQFDLVCNFLILQVKFRFRSWSQFEKQPPEFTLNNNNNTAKRPVFFDVAAVIQLW
jgi:hypothetical protein